MYHVRWRDVHCYPLLANNGCVLWRIVRTDEGWGGPRGRSVVVLNDRTGKASQRGGVWAKAWRVSGTVQLFGGRACQALSRSVLSIILTAGFLVPQTWKNLPAVQETWVWPLGQEDPLEKETATRTSILAWKIPWTEEPGRLQSTGLQRIGHDWAINTHNPHYRERNLVQPLWKTVWRFLKKLKIELSYDLALPLLGKHPEKMKILIKKKYMHTSVHRTIHNSQDIEAS